MNARRLVFAFLLVFAFRAPAEAAPIIGLFYGGHGDAWVGSDGLYIATPEGSILDCCDVIGGTSIAGVRQVFSAAAPTAIREIDGGGLAYDFAGGTFRLEQGGQLLGEFSALPFTYTLGALTTQPQGLAGWPAGLERRHSTPSDQAVSLGAGLLHDDFAALFGLSPYTFGGEFYIAVDDLLPMVPGACLNTLSSTPDPFFHCGVMNYAFGTVDATEATVPEPGLSALLVLGAAGAMLRRRRRRFTER